MAYTLNGTTIRTPHQMSVGNSTQYAQQRTLSGNITRDHFGSNKQIWKLSYRNVQASEFTTINSIYQTYLSTSSPLTWSVSESNYTVSSTSVHIDIQERGFTVTGTDYLSDFDLILTEA